MLVSRIALLVHGATYLNRLDRIYIALLNISSAFQQLFYYRFVLSQDRATTLLMGKLARHS
jgi:hypothetical protein